MARAYKTTAAQRRAAKKYDATEAAKKRRAANNKARRKAQRDGWDKPGDGKDVAHKNNNARDNRRSNLAHQSPSKNRSFKRTKNARRKTTRR